jgi:hydrogenase expression/formation protein HypC
MKIVEIQGHRAVAEANGIRTEVNIALAPDVKLEDKVLVHAGFVIEKLDEEAARDIEAAWEEYLKTLDEPAEQPA